MAKSRTKRRYVRPKTPSILSSDSMKRHCRVNTNLGPPIPPSSSNSGVAPGELEEVRDGPLQEGSLQLVTRVVDDHDRGISDKGSRRRVVDGEDSGIPVIKKTLQTPDRATA